MAIIQIPYLPAVIGLDGPELFEGVQAGTSVKISLAQMIAATRAGLPTTLPIVTSLGGTGLSSFAVGDIMYASAITAATGSLAKLADVALGNAIISGGVGAIPSYGKIGLTTHVSEVLPVANGGTNIATYTIGDILYASTAGVLTPLADVAVGNAIISGGVGVAPSYGKIGLTTHVSGILPVANGGTGQASNLTQYGVVYGGTTTAMATSAAGTTTQVLHGNAAGAPTFGAVSLTADVSGTLPVGNGGTGAITLTGYVKGTGTAALTASATIPNTDISGLGTMSTQAASAVAITGGTINGTTVGATTASTGAFTTLSASSTVSGTGFSTYLASPPAIGGTVAAGGAFTSLTSTSGGINGTVGAVTPNTGAFTSLTSTSGGINGTVGAATASTGAFTTLSASSTVSGTGFSTYLASPPAIGGSAAASVTGAPLASTTVVTDGFVTLAAGTLALAFASKGVVQVTPNATGTFTTTVPPAGTRCTLIVLTSGVTSFTMTFGTGFKTTGTLATGTVSVRYFIFQFISDGTSVIEASRTIAIA